MAADRVIGIVVAVVLLSFLLLLGLNALGQVKIGIFDILKTGEQAMDKLDPLVVNENCEAWLRAGSDKFDPENILEVYRIPDAFAPYSGFDRCCAQDLREESEECLEPDSGCAVVRGEIISECESACHSAILIYNYCNRQCKTEALRVNCFDTLMEDSRNPCRGDPSLGFRDCEVT